jgi:hypothetical protein
VVLRYVTGTPIPFTRPGVQAGAAEGVITTGYASIERDGPFGTPPDFGDIQDVQRAAFDNFAADPFLGAAIGDSSVGYDMDFLGGVTPATGVYGYAVRAPLVISARNIGGDFVQDDGSVYWSPLHIDEADRPLGWVGWVWDDDEYPDDSRPILPDDVTVTLELFGTNHDETTDSPLSGTGGYVIAQTGDAVTFTTDEDPDAEDDLLEDWTDLYEGSVVALDMPDALHIGETDEATINVTEFLDDQRRVLLWARGVFLGGGWEPLPPGDATIPNETLAYGNRFNFLSATWSYTPPGFRWVVEGSPLVRQYPSDDVRSWGASSTRLFPPTKTGRTIGGIT